MKHYAILFRPSIIGPKTWLTTELVHPGVEEHVPVEIPRNIPVPKSLNDVEEYLLTLGFNRTRLVKADGTDSRESGWTMVEFIIGKCGLLTAFWFDEGGMIVKRDVWEYSRTISEE